MNRKRIDAKPLNAYLDNFIIEAVKDYTIQENEATPKTLKEAAAYMLNIFNIEVGKHWLGNYQKAFEYWALGGSLGSIVMTTQEAQDILHARGYYASEEQEAAALEFLASKLYMRLKHHERIKGNENK